MGLVLIGAFAVVGLALIGVAVKILFGGAS